MQLAAHSEGRQQNADKFGAHPCAVGVSDTKSPNLNPSVIGDVPTRKAHMRVAGVRGFEWRNEKGCANDGKRKGNRR